MDNPIKIIHKFKNNNRRNQFIVYIFVGSLISDELENIFESIKDKSLYDTLNNLSKNKIDLLQEKYGEYWYKFFFNKYHIKKQINDIVKNSNKKKLIITKFGKQWFDLHFNTFSIKKTEYSFASNYYDYLIARNKIKTKVKKEDMDFTTYSKNRQFGGNPETVESVEEETEYMTDENIDEKIEKETDEEDEVELKTQEDLDDQVVDNFDLDELTKLYASMNEETDKNIKETAKLISEATNDKSWLKESKETESEFNTKLDSLPYDSKLEDVYEKVFIYEQYIFKDDNITQIRNKIAVSVPVSSKFGKSVKLLPEYQYMWTEYNFNNTIESVMLGQKWIRRNELLKVDIQPNDNINVYEKLKGNLSYLRESFGIKLKREDDENLILRDYDEYMIFNEIYLIDILNELGLNYNPEAENKKNLYQVYTNIYFPFIPFKRFENILDLLNNSNNNEVDKNNNVFGLLSNDVKLEKEIFTIVEENKMNKEKYTKMFENNHVLQSIIHVNLNNPKNRTGTISDEKYDLYKLFDNFIVNDEYPFIQYQTPDTQITYKFYEKSKTIDDREILMKWFETSPYGLSFKINIDNNKFMSINLNENGRLEYKITYREEDKATIDDIKKSYNIVNKLLLKLNSENKKIKFVLPAENKYKYAFINTIFQFHLPNKYKINHNDLSDFCRFFYTYVALVIEPKKRKAASGKESEFSKFGTYLRYKRVSNYENKTRMHLRMLYFLRNFEITDRELIDEIAKQFNITKEDAAYELDQVKEKYGSILQKISKKLQKLKNLPKSKPPGIGIDIQGRSVDNYKIRITGSRSKEQLNEIVDFLQVLVYIYVETYLNKKSQFQKIKSMLLKLNKIAKRRNKVNNIVNYEGDIKEIKVITNIDKKRLGFRPEEGMNQWSRSCQNSGEQRRQPLVVKDDNISKLLKKGYKLNSKTKMYEKEVVITEKGKKKKVVVKAVKLPSEEGKFVYYTCNPEENNEYIHVGFLSKSNNPNDLCMPCCFKKDQADSSNKKKQNYYMKCIGEKKADTKVEEEEVKSISDKIYVLQETNKVQEGRFIFLNKAINQLFNSVWKNDFKIKNHYLIESNSGFFLKFTVKDRTYHFLAAMANIYDTSIDNIKNKCIEIMEKDNGNIFTWLNNGDIKSMYRTKDKYIDFIKNSNYLGYDIVGELLTLPKVLSEKGITYFIIKKKIKIIKKSLEKDDYIENYYIECLNIENKLNTDNDIVFLVNEGKYYFPIYWVMKKKTDKKMMLVKKYDYSNQNYKKIIDEMLSYYNKSCYNNILNNLNILSNYTAKNLYDIIKESTNDNKVIEQIIDERNKVKYLYCNLKGIKQLIPAKPSGTILDLKIINIMDITNKYINDIDVTIKALKLFNKVDMDFIPKTIFYNKKFKGTDPKYNVTSLLLRNNLIVPVKNVEMKQTQFKKYGLSYEQQSLSELVDTEILNRNIIIDERNIRTKERIYRNEGYNLFRLEFSNFLNDNINVRDRVLKIVRNENISKNTKKRELMSLLDNIIGKKLKVGNKIITFMDLGKEKVDLMNYTISNIRQFCSIHKTKESCNNNGHCIYSNNECRFRLNNETMLEYFKKIIEEMIQDKIKFKELIQEDNYYVSDIVDYTQYSNRPDQKIIKTSNFNIKSILEDLFGKNNVPKLGRRSKSSSNTNVEEGYTELIELSDRFIQEVKSNDNSIVRAYVNSYYWLNNNLYDTTSRNLGFYSELQTKLTNLFKAYLIDYILNNTFNKEFADDLSKHIELKETSNFFLSAINRFKKNVNNTDGLVELIVLSYMFNYPIMVYDNFDNVKYIFSNGPVKVNEKTIEKYKNIKDMVILKMEYEGENKVPYKISSIYKK